MGRNMSYELSDTELFPEMELEQAITIQLRSNHYPPVPYSMVPICIEAIYAYNVGDFQRDIKLPEGVLWRGQNSAPAAAIIDSHHLDAWCDNDEDYYHDEP
jgi:hypothetical protein